MDPKVAFITGASRGIGKATAVAMADAGFDVVITARTMIEGEHHDHMVSTPDGTPPPGSLEITANVLREKGMKALPLRMDLLDLKSIDAAVDRAIIEWGNIDLLVNNATFTGKGAHVPIVQQRMEDMERVFQANVFAPFYLTKKIIDHMSNHNGGTIIHLTSGAAMIDPPIPVWEGGWGFSYSASKAAFDRLAGIVNVELADSGIRAFNVNPGVVTSETMLAVLGDDGALQKQYGAAPPSVPAAVLCWIATDKRAINFLGKTINAQKLCHELDLVPDWKPGKRV